MLYITIKDKENVTVSEHPGSDISVSDTKPDEWIPVVQEIPKWDILYDKQVQHTSLIQANVVEIFDKWIQSFFPHNFFKEIRISTEAPFSEFKSYIRTIYKKEAPFLLIDPTAVDPVEDFIFSTNMINRYSLCDPDVEETGAKLMYSLCLMETDKIHILYRRNRFAFKFDIMIMERSVPRRDDLYNFLLMNMRHRSKFSLSRRVATYIPLQMMINVAAYHNLDLKSDEFMEFVNRISVCPIEKRTTPNGRTRFYAHQEVHVHVEVPDFPSKDSAEKSGAIELGARLTDSFILTADLPAEFIAVVPREEAKRYITGVPDIDPEEIFYINNEIINGEINLAAPRIIGERFKLVSRYDIELTKTDKNRINILELIKDMDGELYVNVVDALNAGMDIADMIRAKIYTTEKEEDAYMDNDGILTITNADYRRIYLLFIYMDYTKVNEVRSMNDIQTIGTVKVDL